MVLSLIFGAPKGPTIGPIEVDVALSEGHSQGAEVADHPIETGGDVTDHIRIRAPELSMNGVISDAKAFLSDALASIGSLDAIQKYDRMLELFENREPFDVSTGLRFYPDMVFTRLNVTRDKGTGKAVHFSAELRQIEFADSETIEILPDGDADAAEASAPLQQTADAGPKATKPAPPAAASSSGSTLSKVITKSSASKFKSFLNAL